MFKEIKRFFLWLLLNKRTLALILAVIMLAIGVLMLIYPMFAKTFNEYQTAKAMTEYYSFIAAENEGVTIPG